jgi:cytochrome c2
MLHIITRKFLLLITVVFLTAQGVNAQEAEAAAGGSTGDAVAGETLFKNNCKQCHSAEDKIVVGPGLKGLEDRRDFAWIKAWIQNPDKVINSGDKYAVDLFNKYNKLQMTAFPAYGDKEIHDILAYVKKANEAPAAAAAGATGAAAAGGGETGGGKFFNIILVSLLAIMVLVLLALLAVIRLLGTMSKTDADLSEELAEPEASFGEKLKVLFSNSTVRTAIIWLFIILGTKATLDGLFSIGVHQGYAPAQPINFSHKLHAGDMEIDCGYCHTGVYKGKQAGIPSSSICMNCHNTIKRESPEIQKIYRAIETNTPIEWVRVHNLPDLAYFNHSQHTAVGGLDCENCHGDVKNMEVVQQRSSLTMGWCIDCHRQTDVNSKGNAYYDKLLSAHEQVSSQAMKVEDIGGLECAKCHY